MPACCILNDSMDLRYELGFFHARFGNIDLQLVVGHGIGIEHADGLVGIGLRAHRDERKALGLTVIAVLDDFGGRDVPGLCEQGAKFILGGRFCKISYVQSYFHFVLFSLRHSR